MWLQWITSQRCHASLMCTSVRNSWGGRGRFPEIPTDQATIVGACQDEVPIQRGDLNTPRLQLMLLTSYQHLQSTSLAQLQMVCPSVLPHRHQATFITSSPAHVRQDSSASEHVWLSQYSAINAKQAQSTISACSYEEIALARGPLNFSSCHAARSGVPSKIVNTGSLDLRFLPQAELLSACFFASCNLVNSCEDQCAAAFTGGLLVHVSTPSQHILMSVWAPLYDIWAEPATHNKLLL
mmetsp:Transcript_57740/g.161002  ORF Transcript_57740/g.161002 Transcript_57740/m.161002 type:complete len:239 (-) Transcript_57740:102-818(-)